MFKSIEEGLRVYKITIESFLSRCEEIATKEKQERQTRGVDYMGSIDWPKDAYEWKDNMEKKMEGMRIVLGLSKEEVEVIRKDIKQSITSDS